jgi:hypothetical protein
MVTAGAGGRIDRVLPFTVEPCQMPEKHRLHGRAAASRHRQALQKIVEGPVLGTGLMVWLNGGSGASGPGRRGLFVLALLFATPTAAAPAM